MRIQQPRPRRQQGRPPQQRGRSEPQKPLEQLLLGRCAPGAPDRRPPLGPLTDHLESQRRQTSIQTHNTPLRTITFWRENRPFRNVANSKTGTRAAKVSSSCECGVCTEATPEAHPVLGEATPPRPAWEMDQSRRGAGPAAANRG